jgi:hypothetical protein
MALSFDANYYLNERPDVFQAYIASAGSTGLTWEQFAEQHYDQHGRFEGSNPNATFNTLEYLAANPDVAAAGVNPFTHYLQNGVFEDRAPSNSFISYADFAANYATAYLADNPDLGAAGITTAAQAYTHFVLFGEFENRPGAPAVVTAPASTVALTDVVEAAHGTVGDDVFIGVVDGTDHQTLNTGDTIDGSSGNDTLKVTVTSNVGTIVADLTSVETIEVRPFTNFEMDLSTSTGVKAIQIDAGNNSNSFAEFDNVGNIVDASISGDQELEINYKASVVSGTTDVQNLHIDSAEAEFYVSGVETLNLSVTGAYGDFSGYDGNDLYLDTSGLTTLNISGSGNVDLYNNLESTVTTVDASKATGGVEIDLSTVSDITVTGGSGDDMFEFGGSLTKADVVDGGAGIDTVAVNGLDYTSTAAAAAFNALKGVEVLEFDGGFTTTSINFSTLTNSDVKTILFNDAFSTNTVGNLDAAHTIEFGTSSGLNATTLNLAGSTSTVDLVLGGSEGAAAVLHDGDTASAGDLTINLSGTAPAGTVVTADLHSNGDLAVGAFNSVGTITAVAGSTVVIDGAAAVSIAGLTNNATIDASLLKGSLDTYGSTFAGTAGTVGGAATAATNTGVDTFKLGSASDTIHFNTGDSGTIEVGAAPGFAATGSIYHDVVGGFTAGAKGDVLDQTTGAYTYTAIVATTQDAINALSGPGATLLAAANIAANDHTTSDWTAFSFQGTTYALHETTGATTTFDNTDTIVELTGVSVANLTSANFA